MGFWFRRTAIAVLVVGGFLVIWISTWLESELATWAVGAVWALFAVGIVVAVVRGSRAHRVREQTHVDADPIQAIYQGRKPPTFIETSVDASSQIVDRQHPDPLRLPERVDPRD